MLNLSIIIPCYNEELVIASTANSISQYIKSNYPKLTHEIIFVNDGSTDSTLRILKSIKTKEVKVLSFDKNKGRGEALKYGISNSKGDIVITLDADLSYDVDHIGEILGQFNKDHKTDAVVVSPYMKGGVAKNVPFKRLLISKLANWILAGFFNDKISTVTCVVRGYKGDLIRKIKLLESSKELHLEILYKLGLYDVNVKEIPGRLIWKDSKRDAARKSNLKFVNSGSKHFLYALAIKPTRIFSLLTIVLLSVGLYESFVILYNIYINFDQAGSTISRTLWVALNKTFRESPHTFIIAIGSLIIGFITLCMLIILFVSKAHHEKVMKHLLILLENKQKS